MRLKIKNIFDQAIAEQDGLRQAQIINTLLDLMVPYALQDYNSCREVLQETIGLLEQITNIAVPLLLSKISPFLDSYILDKGRPEFLDYINPDLDIDSTELIKKIEPYIQSRRKLMYELNLPIAETLTAKERQFIASSLTSEIQAYGKQTQWTNDMFQNSLLFCHVLYPICKKDNVLDLLFLSYNNILDRLNTSGYSQHARDVVEGLLMIGYNEQMKAECYYSACRAYTGANSVTAGLLFYYCCLYSISTTSQIVNERFAFELCWQYIKLCRLCRVFPQNDIKRVEKVANQLQWEDYERLSFYQTLFTTRLTAKESKTLIEDVSLFLDMNREAYFKNLEHGAMPWLSLFYGMEEAMPDNNFNGVKLYANAACQAVKQDGNTLFLDYYEENNLARHLRELQYKLQETRNRSDYVMDNSMAMIIAKKIITQAYKNNNVTDFLLAMSTRTDFSTVLPIKEAEGYYKEFYITDAPGEELVSVYDNPAILTELLAMEEDDGIIWQGCGKKSIRLMSLLNEEYSMLATVPKDSIQDRMTKENKIRGLKYEKDVKKTGHPVYQKSEHDYAEENSDLMAAMESSYLVVPASMRRLVIVKDLEIASIPHNLLWIPSTSCFAGELFPICNGISTEVIIKTNTNAPLPHNFTKAFWIPFDSDEFTFDMIYSKLDKVIELHKISVQNELNQARPLWGDMTLLCAHGGETISSTELFYVNGKPIMDSLRFVGKGKVAVLLVCYSGTISQSNYDNAMHTLIKKMLQKGYSSVVAPMWSLATEIITPWLSTFLDSMEKGEYIIDSVHKANMAIKEEYVAASAWACMHLFGNPYMQKAEKPRVIIELDKSKE